MTAWSGPELAGRIANTAMTDRPLRLRTLPCVCGGEITADPHDPTPQVARHNRTYQHRAWWARMEREDWEQE